MWDRSYVQRNPGRRIKDNLNFFNELNQGLYSPFFITKLACLDKQHSVSDILSNTY